MNEFLVTSQILHPRFQESTNGRNKDFEQLILFLGTPISWQQKTSDIYSTNLNTKGFQNSEPCKFHCFLSGKKNKKKTNPGTGNAS